MGKRLELLREVADAVLRINRVHRQLGGQLMRERGSSAPEFSVLFRLARDGQARQSELAHDAALDPGALSRLLRRMADDGLVRVEVDEQDRRQRWVRVTPRGARRTAELLPLVDDMMLRSMEGLTNAQARTLADLLSRVVAPDGSGEEAAHG